MHCQTETWQRGLTHEQQSHSCQQVTSTLSAATRRSCGESTGSWPAVQPPPNLKLCTPLRTTCLRASPQAGAWRWLTSAASPGLRSRFGAISVRFASGALFLVQLQANSPRHKRILPENSEVKRKITNELLIRPEGTAYEAGKAATCMAERPPQTLIWVRKGLRAGEVVGEGRVEEGGGVRGS